MGIRVRKYFNRGGVTLEKKNPALSPPSQSLSSRLIFDSPSSRAVVSSLFSLKYLALVFVRNFFLRLLCFRC